jgi:hypothetical protein
MTTWSTEDEHGTQSGGDMTREQAIKSAQGLANRDGRPWYAVNNDVADDVVEVFPAEKPRVTVDERVVDDNPIIRRVEVEITRGRATISVFARGSFLLHFYGGQDLDSFSVCVHGMLDDLDALVELMQAAKGKAP